MKQMILTASFSDVADKVHNDITKIVGERARVAFFDTAARVEKVTFYVKKAKKWFETHDYVVTMMDETMDVEVLVDTLEQCDIIYISGGNTFYLMQELRKTKVVDKIIEKVSSGTLYIGESAGSMIASPDIAYVGLMDDKAVATELKGTQGLGLISFYPVPHYNNIPFKGAANRIIKQYADLPLETISNHEAIIVSGDTYYKVEEVL